MESRFQRKVSLVVAVIDDVTDQIIKNGSVRVFIPGEKEPVRKREGYYVFTDLPIKKGNLVIQGKFYKEWRMEVGLADYPTPEPFLARVLPSRDYPFINKMRWWEGEVQKNASVALYGEGIGTTYRLLQDYEAAGDAGDSRMWIQHANGLNLHGKRMWIHGSNGGDGEFVSILKRLDYKGGCYQIKGRLSKPYKKTESVLQTVFPGEADANGRYEIPYPYQSKDRDGVVKIREWRESEG